MGINGPRNNVYIRAPVGACCQTRSLGHYAGRNIRIGAYEKIRMDILEQNRPLPVKACPDLDAG